MTLSPVRPSRSCTLFFPAFGGDPRAANATVRTYESEPWTVLEVVGQLTAPITPGLRELLRTTSSTRVVLDLREVTYVDHHALAVVARAHRSHRSRGGAIRLVGPPRSVRTLMRMTVAQELPAVFLAMDEATA